MSWVCPKCERELPNKNQWHNCVKVGIDELFQNKPDELILIFDRLLLEITDWPGVIVSTTKNCIVFAHNQTFLVIRPMTKCLDVKFYTNHPLEWDEDIKTIPYSGRYQHHIRLSVLDNLTPKVLRYIKDSYNIL